MTCLLIFLFILGANLPVRASQEVLLTLSLFEKSERIEGKDLEKPHQLTYWPVIPNTDRVWIDSVLQSRDVDYTIDYKSGQILIKKEIAPETIIRIDYQVIPISIQKSYQRQLFAPAEAKPSEPEKPVSGETQAAKPSEERPSTLNFSGTKTLSLSMESIRGLTINQPTRLNVNGKISESVSVMAMLSDQDLPLQPEGTTEELEELDKILIKINSEHLSATLGDYEAAFGDTEFVLLPKMLEGAQAEGDFDIGGFTLLGAVSKGQSSSITLQGFEGQNAYRVSVDGRYIVMIAGSEEVWLNGEKMRRGEGNDYVIRDYGDPIVEFTNRHLITSSDLIVVDFEYIEEDRNYRQDMYGTRGKVNLVGAGDVLSVGVSYAMESDDKDNPLILLNDENIASLRLHDLDPDGDGELLPAPVKRSVLGFDSVLNLGDRTNLNGEIAVSKLDTNTFSGYDEPEEGTAWKLKGASGTDRLRVNFDLRQLDPEFVPIGATLASRARSTYQDDYDSVDFGDTLSQAQSIPSGETSYRMDLWYEPMEHVELGGDLGRTSRDYSTDNTDSERVTDYWSRSAKIALPNLPQFNTRYQEATTEIDGEEESKKTREIWEVDHRLWETVNIEARNEDIESIAGGGELSSSADIRDRRSEDRRFSIEIPSFRKISLSGEYSFETEYEAMEYDPDSWLKTSSARTVSANLFAKPKSWFDFSGYFARRDFKKLADISDSSQSYQTVPESSTTNLADLKMNLKYLRINYQIDKKLSTEREEQYVNYIIVESDELEEKRFLKPGEGSYVKIDEYTYKEDLENGDYIRLVRNIRDRPVTSLDLQSAISFRPRSSFRTRSSETDAAPQPSIVSRIKNSLSMMEIGVTISEEQENASGKFYLLQSLQTDKTIFGLRKYWYRTQLSPSKRFSITANWETGNTINKRINSRSREFESDRWNVEVESPLTNMFSIGGKWEQDNSSEKVSCIAETCAATDESGVISDISERQRSRSVFLRYSPAKALSRLKLEGAYRNERNDDNLSDDPAVFTRTLSLGSEAMWSFMAKGTTTLRYEIARGTSSGELPFARYDFYEGISHKIRFETNYRLKWFTDITARIIYRAQIAKAQKPDHRLEMEMTANF